MRFIKTILSLLIFVFLAFQGQSQDLFAKKSGDIEILSPKISLTVLKVENPGNNYVLGIYDNNKTLISTLNVVIVNKSGDLEVQIKDDGKENTSYTGAAISDIDGRTRYGGQYASPDAGSLAFKSVKNYILHLY